MIAVAILQLPAVRTPFFADDYLFLDQVRGRSLLEALAATDPLSNYYRPISRQVYFWLIAHATHESALAFHMVGLLTFESAVLLLFLVVRRLAGDTAGVIAAAFLGLHYAADVPLRWACGSQDLLAVVGALAALWLHLRGQSVLAGVALLFGVLSKEVVLLTPVIAVLAGRRPGESWLSAVGRAWPLGAAVGVWARWLLPHAHVQRSTDLEFHPSSPLAAIAHLLQVTIGPVDARRVRGAAQSGAALGGAGADMAAT
jgi:hypothetical protein